MKADSGASIHFVTENDSKILKNIQQTMDTTVVLPNKKKLTANKAGNLPLALALQDRATMAHVLPGMTNTSLLSISQLCDDDCLAIFDKWKLNVYKHKKLVLQGIRNKWDGLWDVPLTHSIKSYLPTQQFTINAIIQKDKTKSELANYLHACAFSPAIPTFQQAIKTIIFSHGNQLKQLILKNSLVIKLRFIWVT